MCTTCITKIVVFRRISHDNRAERTPEIGRGDIVVAICSFAQQRGYISILKVKNCTLSNVIPAGRQLEQTNCCHTVS